MAGAGKITESQKITRDEVQARELARYLLQAQSGGICGDDALVIFPAEQC